MQIVQIFKPGAKTSGFFYVFSGLVFKKPNDELPVKE